MSDIDLVEQLATAAANAIRARRGAIEAGGSPMLQFNVASNGRTRNASGEYVERTEWCRVTILGARAESLSQHLMRGTRVYVDGGLETHPWIDQSNSPRPDLEILADSIEFVSSRQRDEGQQERQPVAAGARYATGADDADRDGLPF